MFTGIITHVGKTSSTRSKSGSLFLTVSLPKSWKVKEGESIATSGVCLTVKEVAKGGFVAELMKETLKKTTFGGTVPQEVNLERSLKLSDRVSGHFVTGHIDAVGKVEKVAKSGDAKIFTVSFPKKFRKLLVEKGSIALDGISLTVVDVGATTFSVAVLPYTVAHTTLREKGKGSLVNLEFDILAKYLYHK